LAGTGAAAAFGLVFLIHLCGRADAALRRQEDAEAGGSALQQQLTIDRSPRRLAIYLNRGVLPDCLDGGWSDERTQPGEGVQSVSRVASLKLVGAPPTATEVALTFEPIMAAGRPFQRVRVAAGGRHVGEWMFTTPGAQTVRLGLPPTAKEAALVLTLEFPDARPLHSEGASRYARKVAIRLDRIEVQ
jgi:hypothetical protein